MIYDLINEAHQSVEAKKENIKINKLILALKENNFDSIDETFKEYQINKEFFKHLKSDNLFDVLVIVENQTLTVFTQQLESRYNFSNVKDYLSSDYDFLIELNNYIKGYLVLKTELSVQDFLLTELSEKITEICKRIRPIEIVG